ncbi:methyltransferase domain-containing protein [Mycoplasmatota bacterium WC30]
MRQKNNHPHIFQIIAPVYGLFFKSQKRRYKKDLELIMRENILSNSMSVIDIGCGTGALASVLADFGFQTTGMDSALGMLKIARRKTKNQKVSFIQGNILNDININDNTFDVSVASYVAHGLKRSERLVMYKEMKRISKHKVMFFEYNQKRNIFSDIIEFLEGGDYFDYIKIVESELKENFSKLTIIPLSKRGALYVCEIE